VQWHHLYLCQATLTGESANPATRVTLHQEDGGRDKIVVNCETKYLKPKTVNSTDQISNIRTDVKNGAPTE